MRHFAALGAMLAGLFAVVTGIAMMAVLGLDGRVVSGPHAVETDAIAVVTRPAALSWTGVRISVLAEVPANKPVFVGLGNAVDVKDYLSDTTRLQVDQYSAPWTVKSHVAKGTMDNLPAAPTALDWWLADSAGVGGASISTRLPDDAVSLAVLSVGSSNLIGLELTVGYEIGGGFALGGGFILLGVGAIVWGRLWWAGTPLLRGGEINEGEFAEEEAVYVYVDGDGVEHVVDTDELNEYEVIDDDGFSGAGTPR